MKKCLEDELHSLRKRVSELERENILKSEEIASAAVVREDVLASAREEITSLKEERSIKMYDCFLLCCGDLDFPFHSFLVYSL